MTTHQEQTEATGLDCTESELTPLLAADHPYYSSDSNYYSDDASTTWETMTDFLKEFEDADVDMNLVFRWDVHERDEDHPGRRYAEVFMVYQRKCIYAPHHIRHINEDEAVRFRAYLEKHWETMKKLWSPLSR
jgi:hypothetical protein